LRLGPLREILPESTKTDTGPLASRALSCKLGQILIRNTIWTISYFWRFSREHFVIATSAAFEESKSPFRVWLQKT